MNLRGAAISRNAESAPHPSSVSRRGHGRPGAQAISPSSENRVSTHGFHGWRGKKFQVGLDRLPPVSGWVTARCARSPTPARSDGGIRDDGIDTPCSCAALVAVWVSEARIQRLRVTPATLAADHVAHSHPPMGAAPDVQVPRPSASGADAEHRILAADEWVSGPVQNPTHTPFIRPSSRAQPSAGVPCVDEFPAPGTRVNPNLGCYPYRMR